VEKEPDIRMLVADLEGLNEGNRKQVDKYLDSFYKDISDPKKKERNFVKKCL